jgi:hypothetical protein
MSLRGTKQSLNYAFPKSQVSPAQSISQDCAKGGIALRQNGNNDILNEDMH